MTNVVFYDFGKAGLDTDNYSFSEFEKDRIKNKKTKDGQNESVQSYTLVKKAYEYLYNKKHPELCFSECGKPYFEGEDVKVSISHTNSFCVVAFSDKSVGVDTEKYRKLKEKGAIIDRFVNKRLQNELKNKIKELTEIKFYELTNTSFEEFKPENLEKLEEKSDVENAFFWTALEALLKTENGFSDIKKAEELLEKSEIKAVIYKDFFVTAAVKK